MKSMSLSLPNFAFIVGTRVALGIGVGLLVAGRIDSERRRAFAAALLAVGAATTIPSLFFARRGVRRARLQRPDEQRAIGFDRRLIGATRFPRKGDDA